MAEYLPKSIGRLWPPTWTLDLPRKKAEGLLLLVWGNLKYRGKTLPPAEPKLSNPAWTTLVQPATTVEDFFRCKGEPLEYPDLPCLVLKGGVRGSSRLNPQRARTTGHPPWNAGQLHEEYLPLEFITYEPARSPEPRIVNSAMGRNSPDIVRLRLSSTMRRSPSRTARRHGEIRVDRGEEGLRIVIPRSWRPVKTITITFAIMAMVCAVGAVVNSAKEIPGLTLDPFSRFHCCFLNCFDYIYSRNYSMPRGTIAQLQ